MQRQARWARQVIQQATKCHSVTCSGFNCSTYYGIDTALLAERFAYNAASWIGTFLASSCPSERIPLILAEIVSRLLSLVVLCHAVLCCGLLGTSGWTSTSMMASGAQGGCMAKAPSSGRRGSAMMASGRWEQPYWLRLGTPLLVLLYGLCAQFGDAVPGFGDRPRSGVECAPDIRPVVPGAGARL